MADVSEALLASGSVGARRARHLELRRAGPDFGTASGGECCACICGSEMMRSGEGQGMWWEWWGGDVTSLGLQISRPAGVAGGLARPTEVGGRAGLCTRTVPAARHLAEARHAE